MATSWKVSTEVDITNHTSHSTISILYDTTRSYIDWYISEINGIIPSPTSLLIQCIDREGNTKDQTDDSIVIDDVVSDGFLHITIYDSIFSVHGEFTVKVYTLVNSIESVFIVKSFYLNRDIREDVIELNNSIDTAIAQIPPSYTALLESIADIFDTKVSYTEGQYVWYNGSLYMYILDHPAGNWSVDDVQKVSLCDTIVDRLSMIDTTIHLLNNLVSKSLLYLGTATALGYTQISDQNEIGYFSFTSEEIIRFTDRPTGLDISGICITFVSGGSRYQFLISDSNTLWFRYITESGTINSWRSIDSTQ